MLPLVLTGTILISGIIYYIYPTSIHEEIELTHLPDVRINADKLLQQRGLLKKTEIIKSIDSYDIQTKILCEIKENKLLEKIDNDKLNNLTKITTKDINNNMFAQALLKQKAKLSTHIARLTS